MITDERPSGLSAVGSLPWGAHFCQFYGGREDLVDTLVPFFKAGLEANEKCLWVTSEPFRAQDAATALRQAVSDLDARVKRGQIEIIDHHDWYTRSGKTDADATLRGWVEREETALAQGFSGLRLTGNTAWVERSDWQGFVDYESRVSSTFEGHHIIGLCSYCLERCQPHDILDVVANHQFALTRRSGAWHVLESASLAEAKNELRRVNTELERRVHERTAELERAVRARDEFLAIASHELKTPLTSLQLYVQGMQRARSNGGLTETQLDQRLARVHEQCRRLEKLMNNLLDVSRSDASVSSLQREPFDLAELVSDCVERFSEEFARAKCAVALDAADPAPGDWDRMRVEQAVTNLLQNATRYAPGSTVRISVEQGSESVRLTVADDGPGVPPEHHTRIFERFAQAPSQQFSGGFGLGLWIVQQVARAHGGAVTLESRVGEGATFRLDLPRN